MSRAFVSENDAWEYCQKAREHCMMAERGKECKVQHCPYESKMKPSTVEQTTKEQDGALVKKRLYLAGGCFWGTEAYFSRLKGVVSTLCGYANGNTANPTYEEVCGSDTGHAETVFVEYDPSVISTEKLLAEFFKTIDPTTKNRQGYDSGTQYRSGIYYVDEADASVITNYVLHKQEEYEKPIVTEVLPLANFYPAEEYHQKYLVKNPHGYCHVDLNLIHDEDRK